MGQQPIKSETKPLLYGGFQLLDRLAEISAELLVIILGYNNENGLNLYQYRNQIFVSKQWQKLAPLSVTNLNLIKLKKNSTHRKCTLLAHLFADRIVHQFPNLSSLQVSLANLEPYEFYNRFLSREKRNFDEEKEFFSDSKRLDKIEANIEKASNDLKDVLLDENASGAKKIFKAIGGICSVAWESYWFNKINKISTDTNEEEDKQIMINLSTEFINSLTELKRLESLVVAPCFDINLNFIQQLPNLRYLHTASPFNPNLAEQPKIDGEKIAEMNGSHNLEILRIGGNIPSNFDGWKDKFPNLKGMDVLLEKDSSLLSLVENFPDLEILKVRGLEIPEHSLQILFKLTRLRRLNLSNFYPKNEDFVDIMAIASLRELALIDRDDRSNIMKPLGVNIEIYDNKSLDLFKMSRPDVEIVIAKRTWQGRFYEEIDVQPL